MSNWMKGLLNCKKQSILSIPKELSHNFSPVFQGLFGRYKDLFLVLPLRVTAGIFRDHFARELCKQLPAIYVFTALNENVLQKLSHAGLAAAGLPTPVWRLYINAAWCCSSRTTPSRKCSRASLELSLTAAA